MKRICIILCIGLLALLAVPALAQDGVETIRVMDRYDTVLLFLGAVILALLAGGGWLVKTLPVNTKDKVPMDVLRMVFDLLAVMATRTETLADDELVARIRAEVDKLLTSTTGVTAPYGQTAKSEIFEFKDIDGVG